MSFSQQNLRAVIYFNIRLSRSVEETNDLMQQAFGDEAPSFETISKWYAEFQRGGDETNDDSHERHPGAAVTDEK